MVGICFVLAHHRLLSSHVFFSISLSFSVPRGNSDPRPLQAGSSPPFPSPTAIRVRAFTFIARRLQPSFSCVVDVVVAVVVASHQICQWVRNNDVYFAVFVIVRCIFLLAGKQLVPDISQASCITPLACAICAEEREAGATMEVHCFFIRGFLNLGSLRPLPPQQKTRGKKRF